MTLYVNQIKHNTFLDPDRIVHHICMQRACKHV